MKKKTVVSVTVVVMLFAISLFFIGGTYARYASEFNGDATVDIAKWNVALKDGSGGDSFTTELNVEENTNVVKGKIAPGGKATGVVEIDLDGTEVAVELKVDDLSETVAEALREVGIEEVTNHDISVSATVATGGTAQTSGDGISSPMIVSLPEGQGSGFTSDDTLRITLTVQWTNNGEEHNADHTKIGKQGGTLTIPVKLTVQQHIAD